MSGFKGKSGEQLNGSNKGGRHRVSKMIRGKEGTENTMNESMISENW